MNKIRYLAASAAIFGAWQAPQRSGWSATAGISRPSAAALEDAFAEVAARAKPAVVNLSVIQEQQVRSPHFFFGDPEDMFREFFDGGRPRSYKFRSQGTGSGFIVDARGYLVTNRHVIQNAAEIRVSLTSSDGKEKSYKGRVVGRDTRLDLAVVKIQSNESFPYLELAVAPPRVGDWAIAIGSPFALEQTVTAGIISARRQSLMIEGRRFPMLLQTDAAINRGNSGGPLLNLQGRVIGINTAIYSPSGTSAGIGFAVPATELRKVLEDLLAGRRVRRGWLGVETTPVDEVIARRLSLPSAEGALINGVIPGSPAAKAGLKRGDVIRRINADAVAAPEDLAAAASRLKPGQEAALEVYRQGGSLRIRATLADRPEWVDSPDEPGPWEPPSSEPEAGVSFQWQGVDFSQGDAGVAVSSVAPDSPLMGYLKPGDLVRGVNGADTPDLAALDKSLRQARLSDGIFLDIVRNGQPLYLSVRP